MEEIKSALESLECERGNETLLVSIEEYVTFGIADSRRLIERVTRRLAPDERQFLVVVVGTMTLEAQQALLKLLEESAPRTHFVIVGERLEFFLPTLRSRLQVILRRRTFLSEERLAEAKEFLALDTETRLVELAKRFNWPEATNRLAAAEFGESLVATWLKLVKERQPALETSITASWRTLHYISALSSSPRLVLEHLALILPMVQ